MELSYKLENFEGPLDLLLHLIEKNKVNIYDIPIALITRQYLDYVNAMPQEDLDIVSDFLVMAATLLDIKSRMLLPVEESDEEDEEDPRAELVRRLLEYKMYKYMAEELGIREEDAERVLYRAPDIPKEVAKYEPPVDLDALIGDLTLAKLQSIFESCMKRQEERKDPVRSKFSTIKKEPVSLEAKTKSLLRYASKNRKFSFRKLLEGQADRVDIVVTFLAVLELMKVGKITITQENLFDDIEIEATDSLSDGDEDMDFEGLEFS